LTVRGNNIADGRETIVILSRGGRLAPMYREAALDLARDYRVVALMYDATEYEIWREAKGIVCIDLAAEMAREVEKHQSRLAERTSEIERETNMPLYKAASNYLLYRRFAKQYTGVWPPFYDTERHMMEEYVGSYGALSRILDEYRPTLILHEALDLVTTLVALALAFHRRIFNIGWMFAPAMSEGTVIYSCGLRRQNFVCSYLTRHPELISAESRQRARALIAKVRDTGSPLLSHVETRRSQLRRPWWLSRALFRSGAWRNPRLVMERWCNLRWLDRNLSHEIPESPFILFLMHLQPEASTASQAPRWVDQERVIEQIAINAPRGIQIVVKENPQCYGWRGKRYFGPLAELPNVRLCHPLVETRELIKRAEALVTITGSAGLEAIMLGTRVATLGRPFYSEFPGVRTLDCPEQIFRELADPSWRSEAFESDRETFIAAYLQSVHPMGEVEAGRKWPLPNLMGPNFAAAVRRTLDFIHEHELTPEEFDPGYPLAAPPSPMTPNRTLSQSRMPA
jgi:hypothetical protein